MLRVWPRFVDAFPSGRWDPSAPGLSLSPRRRVNSRASSARRPRPIDGVALEPGASIASTDAPMPRTDRGRHSALRRLRVHQPASQLDVDLVADDGVQLRTERLDHLVLADVGQ